MSTRTIEFKGKPLAIIGNQLKVGDKFPGSVLHANDFSAVDLGAMQGIVRLISVVPSLDTGVCDAQTKRFNEEAIKLGDAVKIITVSADPPFTQRRWANDSEVKNITVLSDHMAMAFGNAVGVHIPELRLDQRSVFVIDRDDVVRYAEYVPIFGQHPDYDAAIAVVKELL
ncbi:MAG: thiol peroxidase [Chloroflexi bacterium]|nr:thiol peroxidase [Chloroflexota bacterium]